MQDLYSEPFDWPMAQPAARRYFILSTPRVGSTLLGHMMSQVPGAGRPLEYLNNLHRNRLSKRWNVSTPAAFAERLLAIRSSPGGWFGLKLHVTQALNGDGSVQDLFARLYAPDSVMVCLTRRDKVAQAVSFVHASQTGRWNPLTDLKTGQAVYNRALIEKTVSGIVQLERQREAYLAKVHSGPRIDIEYERLSDSPLDAVRVVARCLDLGVPEALAPGLHPMESDLKRDWVNRYTSGN